MLMELFEIDEENISVAAKFGWYKPLVDRMIKGNMKNSFLVNAIQLHKTQGCPMLSS